MTKTKADVVAYRMNRAFDTLDEAMKLAQIGSWGGVVNRLYYACFYMVNALLFKRGLIAKTHSGTKTLFFNEFIRTGVVAYKWSEHYQRLFNLMLKGEYENFVFFEAADVKPLIPKTEDFLTGLKTILDSN